MDDLFKKAADNYLLKTDTGKFDDLLPFVAGPAVVSETSINKNSKRYNKTALLLLAVLLIGGSIATYFIYNSPDNKFVAADTKNKKQNIETSADNQTTTADQLQNSSTNIIAGHRPAIQKDNINPSVKIRTSSGAKYNATITNAFATAASDENKPLNIFDPSALQKQKIYTDRQQTVIAITNPATEEEQASFRQENKETTISIDPVIEKTKINPAEEKVTGTKPGKKKINKPSFYYGISGGVELNQVKGQGMTKPGLNGGLLLGLQVTKKLAVEAGVQLSQKKYYSSGEHFHAKDGDMPGNMKVMSLNGTSTLVEIPVGIKYNLSKKANGIYGKAGVSTYLMTKERNAYKAMVSGQPQNVNKIYSTTRSYAAAELDLSAGYQHRLSKKLNIRVEPYIQIPLKGIGIGSLPVMSTGVHLVLTRN